MPYNSHKLNSSHSHIIARKDPITGDYVKENDRVVFCAVCKSCFLEDSWKYMEERHCEQNQTLETVPLLPSKLIAKKMKEEVIAYLKHEIDYVPIGLLSAPLFFIAFIIFLTTNSNFPQQLSIILSFFGGIISGITIGFILSTNIFRKALGFHNKDVYLFRSSLQIGKNTFYWKDIKQIKFQREMEYSANTDFPIRSKIPTLFLYFHDDTREIKNLPTKGYKDIELFLKGLASISNFTEVYLYSEQSQEHIIIKKIKENTKGNIIVGEPFRLLADSIYPNQF